MVEALDKKSTAATAAIAASDKVSEDATAVDAPSEMDYRSCAKGRDPLELMIERYAAEFDYHDFDVNRIYPWSRHWARRVFMNLWRCKSLKLDQST